MNELFEKAIGYNFKDKSLAILALTHTSYANESSENIESYERLEYLGDALVDFFVGEYLFKYEPKLAEGDMSKLRAKIVCTQSLADCSKKLDFGRYLLG